jgi:hypothetical protein
LSFILATLQQHNLVPALASVSAPSRIRISHQTIILAEPTPEHHFADAKAPDTS